MLRFSLCITGIENLTGKYRSMRDAKINPGTAYVIRVRIRNIKLMYNVYTGIMRFG